MSRIAPTPCPISPRPVKLPGNCSRSMTVHMRVNRNPQRLKAGFCYLPVLCADPAAGVSATAASDVSNRKVSVSCRYRVTVAAEWLE
jgi:hypothetical protein